MGLVPVGGGGMGQAVALRGRPAALGSLRL